MKKAIYLSSLAPMLLVACGEAAEEPVKEEGPTEYSAIGTEPGWTVEFKDGQITHESQAGDNDFTVPLNKVTKTQTGWIINGFNAEDNVRIEITSGKACNDGMSDREYADTVLAAISKVGSLNGCGGAVTEGPDGAP